MNNLTGRTRGFRSRLLGLALTFAFVGATLPVAAQQSNNGAGSTPAPHAHGSPAPSHRTPMPRYNTPMPRYRTPMPRYNTPAPYYRTPAPYYHTPAPYYHTPAPYYHTPAPYYRTPMPRYRTPAPYYHTAAPYYRQPTTPPGYRQAPFNGNFSGGPYQGRFHGPRVRNPRNWRGWNWNRGTTWNPAPDYWGGGFWGSYAIGSLLTAILFGSIIDYQNQMIYPSYQVVPNSPGAEVLQDYGLQQTECGPPNLVIIWGPDNSVICAYPNDLVAPGNYELDPTTLTLVSSS